MTSTFNKYATFIVNYHFECGPRMGALGIAGAKRVVNEIGSKLRRRRNVETTAYTILLEVINKFVRNPSIFELIHLWMKKY